MLERVERVFAFIDDLIGKRFRYSRATGSYYRCTLGRSERAPRLAPEMAAVQMPFLVHAAIADDEMPALLGGRGLTLLYLGADSCSIV